MYTEAEYAAALARARADAEEVLGCPIGSDIPADKAVELLRYAYERTDLSAKNLGADQAAWKFLYTEVKEALRRADPKAAEAVDGVEERLGQLSLLEKALEARQRANLADWGFRVPLGFMIVGSLVGFFRSGDLASIIVGALVSWFAGLTFSIFVLDSADVQLPLGMRLIGKPGLNGLGGWLCKRPLKRFAPRG